VKKSELYLMLAAAVAFYLYTQKSGSGGAAGSAYQNLDIAQGTALDDVGTINVTNALSTATIPSYNAPSYPLLPSVNFVPGPSGAN
jgi:hypothetical protein